MLNDNELIILPEQSTEEFYDSVIETAAECAITKYSRVYPLVVDLTNKHHVERMFGNFATPDSIMKGFYWHFGRPPQQTAADRQLGYYQMVQLLDILIGSVTARATMAILYDSLDESGKLKPCIWIYDGQHSVLLLANFVLGRVRYKTEFLNKAVQEQRNWFGDDYCDNKMPKIYNQIEDFCNEYTGEEFTIDNMTAYVPELTNVLQDKNQMSVISKFHVTDEPRALKTYDKENEHVTAHSLYQKLVGRTAGSNFSNVLFKSDYELRKGAKI